jgi:hypothetical protein
MTHSDHPRRIAPPVKPGTLLMRLAALGQMIQAKEFVARDPVYIALLHLLPCLGGCGVDPVREAHHVKLSSGALGKRLAMGRRPADRWAVPLCPDCHRNGPDALHNVGEGLFWQLKGINPLLVCIRLYAAKADSDKMRAIILATLKEIRCPA